MGFFVWGKIVITESLVDDALERLHTVIDYVRWGASQFDAAELHYGHGYDNAWDEALGLTSHVLHFPLELMGQIRNARLTHAEAKSLMTAFKRRVNEHVPVAYITQQTHFAGLDFYIDERALIPRSPIAELIEQQFTPWVEPENVTRILDLCTGSACLAIAAAHYFPEVIVDAVDLSTDALAVAEKNVALHGLEEKVRLIASDLFQGIVGETYDVIISNPPYVPGADALVLPKEYTHEPVEALEGGRTGLNLVLRILQHVSDYLRPNSILVMEVGVAQSALVEQFPNVPFLWLEFARGGEGIFMLTAEQLRHHQADFTTAYNEIIHV